MKRLLVVLLLLSAPLFGAATPILVDCGSAQDRFFTGGILFGPFNPAIADSTLRFSQSNPAGGLALPFSYRIPVEEDGPYTVTLFFVEPSVTLPGQRLFSVRVNDLTVLDRLDLVAAVGFQVPLQRSFLTYSAGGFVKIEFTTQLRSAVVSAIQLTPFVLTQYIKPSDPHKEHVTDAVPVWMSDAYYVPRPMSEPDPTVAIVYQNIAVYRNGVRQRGSADYYVPSAMYQLKVTPNSGQAWPSTDTVTVDYLAVFPPLYILE